MRRPDVVTLAACILVTLGMNATLGLAGDPKPLAKPSGPSAADVNKAQTRELNALKDDVAFLKRGQRTINKNEILIADGLQQALDIVECTETVVVWLATNPDTGDLETGDGTEPDAFLVGTVKNDPRCVQ